MHAITPYLALTPAKAAVLALVFKEAVANLPAPLTGGSRFYLWFYGTLQGIVFNFDKCNISISIPKAAAPAAPATSAK